MGICLGYHKIPITISEPNEVKYLRLQIRRSFDPLLEHRQQNIKKIRKKTMAVTTNG